LIDYAEGWFPSDYEHFFLPVNILFFPMELLTGQFRRKGIEG